MGGVELLERAIAYALGSMQLITPDAMTRPTPCAAWNLHMLLRHMDESLVALTEAVDTGHIDLAASGDMPADDPVGVLRTRACNLLGQCAAGRGPRTVSVADASLTADVVACAGALEVTVHSWDVARACGQDRPVPASLAEDMLVLARLLVADADRPARFAAPFELTPAADPGHRLVAFLGRNPTS